MLLTLRGGDFIVRPSFGVNGFLKIIFNRVPQNLRGGDGILEDSIVALFPSVPKNKARGKRLELIEDVTFKGVIHPIFQRLSNIAFHSVGTFEKFYNIVQ